MIGMGKIKALIIHPMDPLGNKIGGIGTFAKNFVKYAPKDFEIEWVGLSSDKDERAVGKWQILELDGKKFNFLPILYVRDENVRMRIPLSLKFTLALFKNKSKISLENRILEFHRIEPSMVFKNTRNKKILFVHGDIRDLYSPQAEMKWSKFPWLYSQMEKKLINHMDRIFVVKEDGVNFYKRCYPFIAERFLFLPTWVDEDIFYPYPNDKVEEEKLCFLNNQGLSPNSKLILFVGRLEGAKDPLLLIDTFYYVNKSNPDTRLLVIGNGSFKEKMVKRIIQYKLHNQVHFMGILPQSKVAEIMRISDIFLLTSAFEGMPMSVLEALASGLPVVSTNVGEVKRVVINEFSGMISVKRRPDMLGNLVLRVLNNREIFSPDNCVSSIKGYTAKCVLSKIYQMHYDLEI